MSPADFAALAPFAAAGLVAAVCLLQLRVFARLARGGPDDVPVRDRLLLELAASVPWGVGVLALAAAAWAVVERPGSSTLLFGGQLWFALALFSAGLTALTLRVCLSVVERFEPAQHRQTVFAVRAGTSLLGAAYAGATFFLPQGSPVETLVAVLLLGAAFLFLGLNRTGHLHPEILERLREALRDRA